MMIHLSLHLDKLLKLQPLNKLLALLNLALHLLHLHRRLPHPLPVAPLFLLLLDLVQLLPPVHALHPFLLWVPHNLEVLLPSNLNHLRLLSPAKFPFLSLLILLEWLLLAHQVVNNNEVLLSALHNKIIQLNILKIILLTRMRTVVVMATTNVIINKDNSSNLARLSNLSLLHS